MGDANFLQAFWLLQNTEKYRGIEWGIDFK